MKRHAESDRMGGADEGSDTAMNRPKHPCGAVGCRVLTDNRYCEDHQYKKAEHNRHYDKHVRDREKAAFYHSVEWDRVRQQALIRDHGLCQHCVIEKRIMMADMVHHRFPIRTHWHYRLVLSNLVSLCNSCHAKVDHKKIGG